MTLNLCSAVARVAWQFALCSGILPAVSTDRAACSAPAKSFAKSFPRCPAFYEDQDDWLADSTEKGGSHGCLLAFVHVLSLQVQICKIVYPFRVVDLFCFGVLFFSKRVFKTPPCGLSRQAKLDTQTADWAAKHADFADKKCCPKSSKIPKSLQSQAVPSCFGFNSTVNSEQSAFTPCQVQKPPKSNSCPLMAVWSSPRISMVKHLYMVHFCRPW